MNPPPDRSYIEELKKSLYSRTVPEVQTRRKFRFGEEESSVSKDWGKAPIPPADPVKLNTEYKNNSMSFLTKLFIFSAIFCITVVGVGAYIFWNGSNLISADNIDISVTGPVSIPGGEPVSFDIAVTNNNNVNLDLAELIVSFPPGTSNPNKPEEPLREHRKFIGNIDKDQVVKDSVSAVIYGEENLTKQINITLTYAVRGSTSTFTKTKSYDVLINSSPINVSVSTYKEITSGQEFDIKVSLNSNSDSALKDIVVQATYPFGFNFISSTLPVSLDKTSWSIGDIPTGGKREFTIRGSLSGEDNDLRVFHFMVGTKSKENINRIGTQYMTIEKEVTIQKPFVDLKLEINDEESAKDSIGQYGRASNVTIKWFNNLSTIVSNMKITARLSGTAYDKGSVSPGAGYFNSGSDSIIWSSQTNPDFSSIGPGDSGNVSFSLVPRNFDNSGGGNNPTITVNVSMTGNRTQETNVPSSISSSAVRKIVIPSSINLSGRVVRTVGPFQNSGPIPPKVDNPTTYTVIWSIDNTTSAVGDVEVKATLPPYVTWLNAISPSDASLIYDANSGLVTWSVGTVQSNTSRSFGRKEVAFQISLTPSITQTGDTPILVNQAVLTGVDSFTKSALKSTQDTLTTRFSTDTAYKQGNEVVQK